MKKLATAFGATLVVVAIAAMYLRQELRAQREQNTTAMARVTALESAHSKGPLVAQPVIDGARAATLTPATAALAEPAPAAPAARDLRAQIEQLQKNPQFQEMQRMMMRQMLEQEFPDVAKDFHLDREKAGKLLDLLAKQRMDLAANSMGPQRGGTQDLKALLGDDYAKWGEYERAASERQRQEYARMEREELRHAIAADGVPLTDPQFENLNAAITAEQRRIDEESAAMNPKQQMQRLPEINRRLVEVAASHLNPQQLDRYRRYLDQRQEMIGTMDAMGALPGD